MSLSEFGPFAAVFTRGNLAVPGYLELLNLNKPTAQVVFDQIESALDAGDSERWLNALFADADWRPHLVAAMALLLKGDDTMNLEPLWHAADGGSWVIPQLVVTGLFVDVDFPRRLRSRVNSMCPIHVPDHLASLERHIATGPGGVQSRSAKLLASLLTAGSHIPSLAEFVQATRERPDIITLLTDDFDDATVISEHWLMRLTEQFKRRGLQLEPKAA